MSTIIVLTPIVIMNWPVIVGAVGSAAAALGLATYELGAEEVRDEEKESQAVNSVEVELAESKAAARNIGQQNQIVLRKGDIELTVKRDTRGRCVVCAKGKGKSKAQLEAMAEEFAGKVTQAYVYNKVMNELRAKGMMIANEEVMKDDSIRINVRNEQS